MLQIHYHIAATTYKISETTKTEVQQFPLINSFKHIMITKSVKMNSVM
jgi:hypothetical protein